MQTRQVREYYRNVKFSGGIWNFSRKHFQLETPKPEEEEVSESTVNAMLYRGILVIVMSMTTVKLPLTLLLMIAIISTVSFLPVQEAKASIELKYDDGTSESTGCGGPQDMQGVLFSLPSGINTAKLMTVRIFIDSDPDSFALHIFDSDKSTQLLTPIPIVTPSGTGWFDIDVAAQNIVVTGDFIIMIEWETDTCSPQMGIDQDLPISARSIQKAFGSDWSGPFSQNYMIRVVIDPIGAVVGGVVLPTNTLAILTPYLALAGLVAIVSAVVVVKRRRD